jgi:hypothetical protein
VSDTCRNEAQLAECLVRSQPARATLVPTGRLRGVPGGQMLIRLSSIVAGSIPQHIQPILGTVPPGDTGVGQPVSRESAVRIGHMLKAVQIQLECPPTRVPVRSTETPAPPPVAVNLSRRYMAWPTCRLSAVRAEPEPLPRRAPMQ